MAGNKEAICILLDVGPAMNQAPPGEETALQTSLDAISMILQRKMFAESKDEVSLVLIGSDETANILAGDGQSYENIKLARDLKAVDWDLLNYVRNDIKPTDVSADFLDGLIVGMDSIMAGIMGKRGFTGKRVILFSNVGGEFGTDQLDDIIASMKEQNIELNVIGPDLEGDDEDDEEDKDAKAGASNGHVKEKSDLQKAGEKLLSHIIEQVDGVSYSFREALPALSFFQSRQVRPTAWKCPMVIGPHLSIPIQGFIKLKEAKAKSYKNVYAKDADADIQRLRTFHLNDEEETEIDEKDTVAGLRYGSTLVPFTEDDKEAMKFKAEKCFKVLGFTKSENVQRHQAMGDSSMVIIAEKGDEAAGVALSAFIWALYETNMVAIVRRCYSNASAPKLACLTPQIKAKYECLYYTELPFAEDVRQYTFGSLPVSEEDTAANAKHKPSDEQLSLMEELIDTMDLSTADLDEDGEARESLKPKLTFNPHLQRLYQCLQERALNPDDPLPDLSEVVKRSLQPPEELATKCEDTIEKAKKLFKLEVVKKKEDDKENMFNKNDDAGAPAAKKAKVEVDLKGGMDDLLKAKVTEVGTVKPVEDFKAIIGQKDKDRFEEGCQMMQKRIIQIVTDSFGNQYYEKAMECLKALRQESVKNSESKMFNDYLTSFRTTLKDKGRTDFWEQIVVDKLSLISKAESEDSKVTKEEAEKFITAEPVAKDEKKDPEPEADDEDLLGMME